MGHTQVIAKAKVPIIKFETVEHGNLAFDISFDVPNGPQVPTPDHLACTLPVADFLISFPFGILMSMISCNTRLRSW